MTHTIVRGSLGAVLVAFLVSLSAPGQSLNAATAPYWQQDVAYRLTVQLDDRRHELNATEELTYVNHSPDRLDFIWFHLWPNAYRDNGTAYARQQLVNGSRTFHFAPDSSRGFIDGLSFTVDGVAARLEPDPRNPDIAKLILPRPLPAGGKVEIRTPFRVRLPYTFSRGGHIGQAYQITQWYPKPAVYDRAGWHPMPYLDQGEFYSEFGSFDVSITLPANYVVGATGQLQNAEERRFLDSLAADGERRIPEWSRPLAVKERRKPTPTPPSSPRLKTLRYVQDHVHDFAWFADKRYLVLKSGVTLPRSGRHVDTWLMFTRGSASDWLSYRGDIDAAVLGYSRLVGEYPYSAATAVAGPLGPGTGGMEYPMVTITEPSAIIHEVGHNWFYGILASNERDYPWMDEGVNSYIENRIKPSLDSTRKNPETGKPARDPGLPLNAKTLKRFGFDNLPRHAINDVAWQMGSSRGLNQPVGARSVDFHGLNYGTDVYFRAPALLRYLAAYLGQARFDSCMHAYYRAWQFRHPYPADMLRAFNERSGEDLSWFFRDQLNTLIRPDAALARLRVEDSIRVRVLNNGDSLLSVPVATVDARGRVLHQRWTPLFRDQGIIALPLNPAAASVVIDPNYIVPTFRRSDDRLRMRGVLRAWNPLRIRPLIGPERWDQTSLYWAPALGANTSDKFMLGLYLSNSSLIQRRIRFTAVPLYSFSRNEVNGLGEVAYSVLGTGGRLSEAVTGLRVARFERYLKLEPNLTLHFRQPTPRSPRHLLALGITLLRRDPFAADPTSGKFGGARWGRYEFSVGDALQRLSVTARFENYYVSALTERLGPTIRFDGANMGKLAVRYQRYYSHQKSVTLRLFAGNVFGRAQDYFFIGLSNSPDYLRETAFLDRARVSRALQAGPRQTDDRDGAFHAWVPVLSNRWLTTASIEAQVPYVPLIVYGDVGAARGASGSASSYYGTGLVVPMLGNFLRLYLPLAGSNYANDTPASFGDFSSAIRFSLNLHLLAPERQLRNLLGQ